MQPDRLALLLLLASVAAAGAALSWRRAGLLATVWIASIFFLPVWAGITVVIGWQPAAFVGIGVLTLLLLDRQGRRLRLRWYDAGVIGFLVVCVLASVASASTLEAMTTPVAKWAIGYAVGRTLYSRIGATRLAALLAIAASIAAALAVAEFVFHHNVFFDIPWGQGSPAYQIWAVEQERAGEWRVEGAFGHSIAFGVCLAATLPAILTAKFRPAVTVAMSAVVLAGLTLTFSRLALMVALLAALLVLANAGSGLSPRARLVSLLGVIASAAVALPVLWLTVDKAGTEAAESADYRARLWDLTASLDILGTSSMASIAPNGRLFFGSFRSIDNAILLMALTYGWLPALIFLALAAVAVVSYFRGFCSSSLVGVLALGPALISVAFITQYEVYFFALIGMTCAAAAERASTGESETESIRRTAGLLT